MITDLKMAYLPPAADVAIRRLAGRAGRERPRRDAGAVNRPVSGSRPTGRRESQSDEGEARTCARTSNASPTSSAKPTKWPPRPSPRAANVGNLADLLVRCIARAIRTCRTSGLTVRGRGRYHIYMPKCRVRFAGILATWIGLLGCGPDKKGSEDATAATTGPDAPTTGGSTATAPTTAPNAPTTSTTTSGAAVTSSGAMEPETITGMTGDSDSTGDCFQDGDCPTGECVAQGESCTTCREAQPTCIDDIACAPGDVCIEIRVSCPCDTAFETICSPLCATPADCGGDATCDVDSGHCVVDPCVVDGDCPPLFVCVDAVGGAACRRRPCASDSACDGARCVDGRCHETPGVCVATRERHGARSERARSFLAGATNRRRQDTRGCQRQHVSWSTTLSMIISLPARATNSLRPTSESASGLQ